MVKRYCDMCGGQIYNGDFRILSLTDAKGMCTQLQDKYINETIDQVELCRACAGKIIMQLKKDNF